jgi:16S rRNA (guanine527-N7)-methyltransferase
VSDRAAVAPAERLITACAALGVTIEPAMAGRMIAMLDQIAIEPQNLTAIDVFDDGIARHLVDSLSALVLDAVRSAASCVDLGSGGGFPGVPLAIAKPECAITLVESEGTKAGWLARATADLPNVRVVGDRTESLATAEREQWEVATARALAPLAVVVELAAPLVALDGSLVVWRGPRDVDEEHRAAAACSRLGWEVGPVTAVMPFPGASRHLHEFRKRAPTPERFPRRPGRAAKRPLA